MTKQEAAIAFAQGKNIEWSWGDGNWFAADAFRHFDLEGTQYRLKLEPVPPGDLTYEEACECIKRHEPVQRWRDGEWVDSAANAKWNCDVLSPSLPYRRKPTPKRVTLGPDDVPPGSIVRANIGSKDGWCSIGAVVRDQVSVVRSIDIQTQTYAELMEWWEISRDGGKTWKPCWKESSE